MVEFGKSGEALTNEQIIERVKEAERAHIASKTPQFAKQRHAEAGVRAAQIGVQIAQRNALDDPSSRVGNHAETIINAEMRVIEAKKKAATTE